MASNFHSNLLQNENLWNASNIIDTVRCSDARCTSETGQPNPFDKRFGIHNNIQWSGIKHSAIERNWVHAIKNTASSLMARCSMQGTHTNCLFSLGYNRFGSVSDETRCLGAGANEPTYSRRRDRQRIGFVSSPFTEEQSVRNYALFSHIAIVRCFLSFSSFYFVATKSSLNNAVRCRTMTYALAKSNNKPIHLFQRLG